MKKARRIGQEEKRLAALFAALPEQEKQVAAGLIQRAAYLRVQLEDFEADLDDGGYVEMFTQSPSTPPYERERPVVRLYATAVKNYAMVLKQLKELLPASTPAEEVDAFDRFLGQRA